MVESNSKSKQLPIKNHLAKNQMTLEKRLSRLELEIIAWEATVIPLHHRRMVRALYAQPQTVSNHGNQVVDAA